MNKPQVEIETLMSELGVQAVSAAKVLARASAQQRSAALSHAAAELRSGLDRILAANEQDIQAASARGVSAALLDRLSLDEERVQAMASGLETISAMPDPIGCVVREWPRPNGLQIQRVTVPLGVIGIIYESRPNVTADAAALCLKSGNAVILRGGSDSYHSSLQIHACIVAGLKLAGLPAESVQIVTTRDRDAVGFLLSGMAQWLDVVVPRGGRSLVERVQKEARVPVIGHLDGICHVYLHRSADAEVARQVVLNSKMRRTGICGAAETILIDRDAPDSLLPEICAVLQDAGCEVRGDATVVERCHGVIPASENDWRTEYLDAVVSIRLVADIDEAMDHIATYGSGHTECIIATDDSAAERFLRNVDSAIVMHNASTQFADGGEFGMGAEIGIATGRIHARGPVGAEQLTSYKYLVRGDGQVRPA